MNVAPDDPPHPADPSVVPGVVLGGAIGGALLGATDVVVASAAAGLATPPVTLALCSGLWFFGGALSALPWALVLQRSVLSRRPSVRENPRWWGVHIGATGAALAFVWADLGSSAAWIAAGPLLLCSAALSVLLESSRSRIFGMAGLLAGLSIWSVVAQRPGPSDWPGGQARSVLLVTLEGLRASDLEDLPEDGAWAQWSSGGTTFSRLLLPADDRSLSLRSLWRGEAGWAPDGLAPGAFATAADRLARQGWQVEGHLGAGDVEDPGLTRRQEEADWVALWRSTRTGRVLGARTGRARAREVVAAARGRVETEDPRAQLLWIHLADGRFPWQPSPPWDTAFYAGDPWDPATAAPLPPAVREAWPEVLDPSWVSAQRRGALASMDDALVALVEALPTDGSWAVAVVGLAGTHPLAPHDDLLDARTGAALLWAPGTLPAGARVDAPVELSTLAETLVDLTGAPTESTGQASLVPLAFGRRPPPFARTSSRGMPVLVSAQQTWSAGDGQAPTEEWEAAAAALTDALP